MSTKKQYVKIVNRLLLDENLTVRDIYVYMCLCRFAKQYKNTKERVTFVGLDTLRITSRLGKSTVLKHLKNLEEWDLIKIYKSDEHHDYDVSYPSRSNLYVIKELPALSAGDRDSFEKFSYKLIDDPSLTANDIIFLMSQQYKSRKDKDTETIDIQGTRAEWERDSGLSKTALATTLNHLKSRTSNKQPTKTLKRGELFLSLRMDAINQDYVLLNKRVENVEDEVKKLKMEKQRDAQVIDKLRCDLNLVLKCIKSQGMIQDVNPE